MVLEQYLSTGHSPLTTLCYAGIILRILIVVTKILLFTIPGIAIQKESCIKSGTRELDLCKNFSGMMEQFGCVYLKGPASSHAIYKKMVLVEPFS